MKESGFVVEPSEAGERLDKVLVRRYPDVTRSVLGRLIREGHVALEAGGAIEPGRTLKVGELVAVSWPEPEASVHKPEPMPLDILFEDEELLVVCKPAGLVVHPSAGHWSGTLVNALVAHVGELPVREDDVLKPGIVHRLDKDTSGAIIVAKTQRTLVRLQRQFQARRVSKTYLALVLGGPESESGRIERAIARSRQDPKRMSTVREGGRAALTLWRVRERLAGCSLIEVELVTGRTHQIRVHFASIGHPLVGDRVYGRGRQAAGVSDEIRELLRGFPRQALHAHRLRFSHPSLGSEVVVESPLPADIVCLMSELRALARTD